MSSKTFTQAVSELAILPDDALTQVLRYIETLKRRYPLHAGATEQIIEDYPLRGEAYTYVDPFEPAVLANLWDAIGEGQ